MVERSFVVISALCLSGSALAARLPCGDGNDDPREAALACLTDESHRDEALTVLGWVGTEADVERIGS